MKRSLFVVLIVVTCLVALATFSACTELGGGMRKYTLEVKASVENVPDTQEITLEYVKSIISVNLKWNDGTTTFVSLGDCEISYNIQNDNKKLEIKVKFGKKSNTIQLDIVDPQDADDFEPNINIGLEKMVRPEDAQDENLLKLTLKVFVSVNEEGDFVEIAPSNYSFAKREIADDNKSVAYQVYVPEYNLYSDDVEVNFYENPKMFFENGEFANGMNIEEIESILQNDAFKVFIEGENETKDYIDFDYELTDCEEFISILFKAKTAEYESYGYTHFEVSKDKYFGLIVIFDYNQWKKAMTDDEIIARLVFLQAGEVVQVDEEISIEREEFGMVRIYLADRDIGIAYVGYDEQENPFAGLSEE